MSRRFLRVGIVGAGWVATARHIPAFKRAKGCEIVGIVDPKIERGRATARRYNIALAVRTLDELLDHRVDVVSICTPPWTHAELARKALKAGVHVFTEKPMATTTADAASMLVAAQEARKTLCVSHNFLFSRSARRAQKALAARPAERPLHVAAIQLSSSSRRLPSWYERLPGGLFFDEAPHMIYLLRHFLGDLRLVGATATRGPSDSRQLYRSVQASFESKTGSASLLMVFDSPVSEWLISIITPSRVVILDLFRDICVVLGTDRSHGPKDVLRTSLSAMWQHVVGVATSGVRYYAGRLFYGHDVLIERFARSIREGVPPPVTGEDGLAVTRVLEDIGSACGFIHPVPETLSNG